MKKSDRQQCSDDWSDLANEQITPEIEKWIRSQRTKDPVKKTLKTYKVTRTVEYTMLVDGKSKKDVVLSGKMSLLDMYWTKNETKVTIDEMNT